MSQDSQDYNKNEFSVSNSHDSDENYDKAQVQDDVPKWGNDSNIEKQDDQNDQNNQEGAERKPRKPFADPIMPSLDGDFLYYEDFMKLQEKDVNFQKARKLYDIYKKKWSSTNLIKQFKQIKDYESVRDKYLIERQEKLRIRLNQLAKLKQDSFIKIITPEVPNLEISEKILQNILSIPNSYIIQERSEDNFLEIQISNQFNIDVAPFFGIQREGHYLYFPNIPKEVQLDNFFKVIDEWDIKPVDIVISDLLKSKEYSRMIWLRFNSFKDLSQLGQEIIIGDTKIDCQIAINQNQWCKVINQYEVQKLDEDIVLLKDLIQNLDKEKNLQTLQIFKEQENSLNLFDLCILYLRTVHLYCFWSGAEFSDERTLALKCGNAVFRLENTIEVKKLPQLEISRKIARNRIKQSQNPEIKKKDHITLLIKDYLQEHKYKAQNANLNVFLCEFCEKQFAGAKYIQQHLQVKHENNFGELSYQNQIDELNDVERQMFLQYLMETHAKSYFEKLSKIKEDELKEINEPEDDDQYGLPLNFLPSKQIKPNYRDLDNLQFTEKIGKPCTSTEIPILNVNYNDI